MIDNPCDPAFTVIQPFSVNFKFRNQPFYEIRSFHIDPIPTPPIPCRLANDGQVARFAVKSYRL